MKALTPYVNLFFSTMSISLPTVTYQGWMASFFMSMYSHAALLFQLRCYGSIYPAFVSIAYFAPLSVYK